MGEVLAQASVQTELLVCKVSQVPHKKYIGRAQYPRFKDEPSVYKNGVLMISSRALLLLSGA